MISQKNDSIRKLKKIPGIGPSMAEDLYDLGMRKVSDLKKKDPELLYKKLCILRGIRIDRCVLYAFRCAVYFASEHEHKPELLKWWNWKDKK
ncbi:pathogenicity locus [candidate division WOR-3 bacterium]|nr:pathogenicity locus [candidate division WOR-3 bacterium]